MWFKHRRGVAGAMLVIVAAACGPVASESVRRKPPPDLVVLRTAGGLAAVDSTSGDVLFRAGGGVASPNWAHVFATELRRDATVLKSLDPQTGTPRERTALTGRLEARVASDGGLVALTPPTKEESTVWLPAGRRRTTVAIADSRRERSRYLLPGNFEPEAFSVDGQELFMIEYIPPTDPNRYRVRRLILDSGRVRPIGRLKQAAPGQMRGTGRTQVFSPGADELYALYTKQGPNYAHGEASHRPGRVHAFVHVLNLRYRWAHCIDLPPPFGTGDAVAHALAISRTGDDLYVVDPSTEMVARIHPDKLRVLDTAHIDLESPRAETVAAEVVDGTTLFVANADEVLSLDADSLEVERRWTVPGPVTSLQTGSDGKTLIVGTDDGLRMMDVATGTVLGTTEVEGAAGPIVHVGKRTADVDGGRDRPVVVK